MNAYKLQVWQMTVDEVKALIETNRQQTDRIAKLEKDLALKTRDRDVFCDFTLAYEKRIEELEKLEQDFIRVIRQTNPNKLDKELSDEEICGIAGKLSIATTEIENDWAFCVVEFARAIIKASRGEE